MDALPLGLEMVIYLVAAIVAVPVAHRLGLGSVIGYLLAGILIGPFVLGIGHLSSAVMSVSEIGVVMMLFLIGLELDLTKLWEMRQTIIGLGGLQMILSSLALAGVGYGCGLSPAQALAAGTILAFSSTAIVLPSLQEKGLLKTPGGQAAFAVLLTQEIAVIPVLAFLPLLATAKTLPALQAGRSSATEIPGWWHAVIIVAAVAALVLSGRYLLRPFFRWIASTHLQELFTASALLIVIGIILLMDRVDLDPAVGAFIGGVVLAESEYRHQIEADIAPFKGLLLGLFFVAVGASIHFGLLFREPVIVMALVLGLMLLKFLILLFLGRLFKMDSGSTFLLAIALAQGDEFAFVLIPYAQKMQVLPATDSSMLNLTVTLSMALTPLLFIVNERWIQPRFAKPKKTLAPDPIDHTSEVLLVGFGRFGNIVGRYLRAHQVQTTVLDFDPEQIETVRKLGLKAYYGDATRLEILRTAGAAEAKLLLVMVDNEASTLKIVKLAQQHFPQLKIIARAVNRSHGYELHNLRVSDFHHEMLGSALDMGEGALKELGFRDEVHQRTRALFYKYERRVIQEMASMIGKEGYFSSARKHIANLENAIAAMKDFSAD